MSIFLTGAVELLDMVRILVADPEPETREGLQRLLGGTDSEILATGDGEEALRLAIEHDVDVVIAELSLPHLGGAELVRELHAQLPTAGVILLTAFGTVEDAVHAMREGAADFLSKPFSSDQVRLSVERTLEHGALIRENRTLRDALDVRSRLDNLIATSDRMRRIFKTVRAVAETRTTALITGESGTGKTLLARAIHRLSDRAAGPFVEVNCGALPETLLESELFGHVRGAFTGATRDREGKFEAANGGTIFLDEIGTSSPGFQVRLLRVLQDRVIERVGDTRTRPVDVRVVLATNLDLQAAVADGSFREDLYYRINVVAVEMPPLRERREDIPFLAEHFLQRITVDIGKSVKGFRRDALEALMRAPFPGNVRQLENVVERAVVLAETDWITVDDLPPDLTRVPRGSTNDALVPDDAHLLPLKQALEAPERVIIERALRAHDGNRQETADSLGINRSTLFNKMRKFGLL